MGRSGLPTTLLRASAAVGVPGAVVLAAWGTGALGTLGLYAPMAEYRLDAPPEATSVAPSHHVSTPVPTPSVGAPPVVTADAPRVDRKDTVEATDATTDTDATDATTDATTDAGTPHSVAVPPARGPVARSVPHARATMMSFGGHAVRPSAPPTVPTDTTIPSRRVARAVTTTPASPSGRSESDSEHTAAPRRGLLALPTPVASVSVLSFG